MSLENIKYKQEEINRYLYKETSWESLSQMWNDFDLYDTLKFQLTDIFKWDEKKIKVERTINGEKTTLNQTIVSSMIDGWLDEAKIDLLCQENKRKSIDLIYSTFDVFDYSDRCLNVLDLLSLNGAALFYIPALDYRKMYKYINSNSEFYITAIIGAYDERDSTNPTDQQYIIPLSCKYLAVLVTRKKREKIYLWPEFSIFDGDHQVGTGDAYESLEYLVKDLKIFINDDLCLTDKDKVYDAIISANRVVVKTKEFYDVESFYTNAQIIKTQKNFLGLDKNKLINLGKNIANDPFSIVNFLKCINSDGSFDLDKWNFFATNKGGNKSLNNGLDSTIEDKMSNLFEALDNYYEAKEYTPNDAIKKIEHIIIVETYCDKHIPPYIKIVHPFDWNMGSVKSSAFEDGSFYCSLIALDTRVVIDKYLGVFLESEYGLLSVNKALAHSENYETAWQKIEIPVPDIAKQKVVASAINSVTNLDCELNALKDQLIKNPSKALEIDNSLKEWLVRLDKLSLDEKITELVKNGETEAVEFKETLSLDIKKQTKEKYIEHSSLKTIAGFLNSKGGVLLVGVSDNGLYPGIFEEVEKFHKANFDKFLLHFKNLIKRSIGEEFYPYIEYQLVVVNESKVLYVNCVKSEKPCYLDGKDFYVRTNPATDKLEGPQLVDYIQNHFNN